MLENNSEEKKSEKYLPKGGRSRLPGMRNKSLGTFSLLLFLSCPLPRMNSPGLVIFQIKPIFENILVIFRIKLTNIQKYLPHSQLHHLWAIDRVPCWWLLWRKVSFYGCCRHFNQIPIPIQIWPTKDHPVCCCSRHLGMVGSCSGPWVTPPPFANLT